MKVVIVDDEKPAREAIRSMVSFYCANAQVTGCYGNLPDAIDAIRSLHPDVVLLDIEIGSGNGFDILKQFPDPSFKVIFITAYHHYAIEAFRFSALDYLLKPVNPDLLQQALNKAANMIDQESNAIKIGSFLHNLANGSRHEKKLVLKTANDIHVVHISDIMYCEADHSYTTFYLQDRTSIVVSCTLGDYEELLKDFDFVRIHQSYLLNMAYLVRYEKKEGGNAILRNNTRLPVATRKREQFLQRLARF